MGPHLTTDIFYDVVKYMAQPSEHLNLCLMGKSVHQTLYPGLIRKDFFRVTDKKSLWRALEDDNAAQLETIYAIMYPNFSEYVREQPNQFSFWLQYVVIEGVYGGLNCLRLMLARAAEAEFVPGLDVLSAAVEGHNYEAIDLLLEYGAPITRQGVEDESGPLFRVQSVDMFHYLVARGADPLEKFEGKNLLHWHCSQLSTSPLLIETLIEAGLPVDELDSEGFYERIERYTPLGYACSNLNLPAMRVLIQHGANPFGSSIEAREERSRDAGSYGDYVFPYPLESLMEQTINIRELGWGQCLWYHHISSLHEEQDDREQEVEEPDTILPLPPMLSRSRFSFHEFFSPRQKCHECSRGFYLADIDSDITEEAEQETQAGLLRFRSWTSQLQRFAHRYFRAIQILLEAGGPDLCREPDFDPVEAWFTTFSMPLLKAGILFSPYSDVDHNDIFEPSTAYTLVDRICQWDLVATTCVAQLDYLLGTALHPSTERGLEMFHRVVSEYLTDNRQSLMFHSPIAVQLNPVAPFIGPSRKNPSPGWTQRYIMAWELDSSRTFTRK
ncbi:hypothetical protein FHL15_005091 [Xylaria flabelliformis]|uniref:Uncharacterized protein n=1 Tax=Xylaria flabelliformis TaxID=2512241 RepID=A0A553I1D2_9PEZI|nr:hypothetical protein FHL15_005091 [Xylaria flabelliformis]